MRLHKKNGMNHGFLIRNVNCSRQNEKNEKKKRERMETRGVLYEAMVDAS